LEEHFGFYPGRAHGLDDRGTGIHPALEDPVFFRPCPATMGQIVPG
jgi:hypothetical protein